MYFLPAWKETPDLQKINKTKKVFSKPKIKDPK